MGSGLGTIGDFSYEQLLHNLKHRRDVGSYSGTAGDSLALHKSMTFTTKDRDNDIWSSGECLCGVEVRGGTAIAVTPMNLN